MKKRIISFLLLILFLAAFTVFSWFLGGAGITLDFGEDALTVSGPKKFSFSVDYDRIADLDLVELSDTGTLISGGENRSYSWGTWETGAWDRYTLCAAKKADTAILITTQEDELLVFSYQDDETTAAVFQMFTELLAHRAEAETAA